MCCGVGVHGPSDTYWEAGDDGRAIIRLTWGLPEGSPPPSVSAMAVFVDRVKDPVLRTMTLSAGNSHDTVSPMDVVTVADSYVGWVVLCPEDGKPINTLCIQLILAGANRLRIRG
jgi:hypothetical protein